MLRNSKKNSLHFLGASLRGLDRILELPEGGECGLRVREVEGSKEIVWHRALGDGLEGVEDVVDLALWHKEN